MCIEELTDGVDAGVTGAQGAQLRKLLQEFGEILSINEYVMGQTWITKHRIDIGTPPPIRAAVEKTSTTESSGH